MPQIKVEGADDFHQEVVFSSHASLRMRDEIWEAIVGVAEQAKAEIKRDMPVDTGDARGRWGTPEYVMTRPRYGGAPGQGIWRPDRLNLAHTQGAELSPYEYIERLNEGSSTQAPAGFIDSAVERAMDKAEDDYIAAFVEVWDKSP